VVPLNWTVPVAVIEVVPVTPEETPPMLLSPMAFPVIVSEARGVEVPMGCVIVTFPLPARIVNACAPLIAPATKTPPVPALLSKVPAATRLTGMETEICPLSVTMLPAKLALPVPSTINEPSIEVVLPGNPDMIPETVVCRDPPLVVTREPARLIFVPTKVIPAGAFVFNVPVMLIVPLPAN